MTDHTCQNHTRDSPQLYGQERLQSAQTQAGLSKAKTSSRLLMPDISTECPNDSQVDMLHVEQQILASYNYLQPTTNPNKVRKHTTIPWPGEVCCCQAASSAVTGRRTRSVCFEAAYCTESLVNKVHVGPGISYDVAHLLHIWISYKLPLLTAIDGGQGVFILRAGRNVLLLLKLRLIPGMPHTSSLDKLPFSGVNEVIVICRAGEACHLKSWKLQLRRSSISLQRLSPG